MQLNIMVRIIIAILLFVAGFALCFWSYDSLRGIIQDVFTWSTGNSIVFNGKEFYLFANPITYIVFGLVPVVFYFANRPKSLIKWIQNGVLFLVLFALALVIICAVDAKLKVIQCTACQNGVRALGYNQINYGLILSLSVLAGLIPSVIRIFRKQKTMPKLKA